MQNVEKAIEELFNTSGGRIFLKTREAAEVLDYGKDWMDKRVAEANGTEYVEFGDSKNAQKKYRIDHAICYRLHTKKLSKLEMKQLLTEFLIKRYGAILSMQNVQNIFSMSNATYKKYMEPKDKTKKDPQINYLPSSQQHGNSSKHIFEVKDIVIYILQFNYVQSSATKEEV